MASSVFPWLTRNPDLSLHFLRGDKEGVKGLPRSFQSLAKTGMMVSLQGIFLFCHSRENGNPERNKLDSCSRIPSKKPTGRNDKRYSSVFPWLTRNPYLCLSCMRGTKGVYISSFHLYLSLTFHKKGVFCKRVTE